VLNDADIASIRWLEVSYLSDGTRGYIERILEWCEEINEKKEDNE